MKKGFKMIFTDTLWKIVKINISIIDYNEKHFNFYIGLL